MAPIIFPPRRSPTPNQRPSRPAFRCSNPTGYQYGAQLFHHKHTNRLKELGPWDEWTLSSFLNWLICLLKQNNFDEVEQQCHSALRMMEADGIVAGQQYLSIQCILSSCLFLLGELLRAETCFTALCQSHEALMNYPSKDHFEVLCCIRAQGTECLVLRDSRDGVEQLPSIFLVEDYMQHLHHFDHPQMHTSRSGPLSVSGTSRAIVRHSPSKRASILSNIPAATKSLPLLRKLSMSFRKATHRSVSDDHINYKIVVPQESCTTQRLNGSRWVAATIPEVRLSRSETQAGAQFGANSSHIDIVHPTSIANQPCLLLPPLPRQMGFQAGEHAQLTPEIPVGSHLGVKQKAKRVSDDSFCQRFGGTNSSVKTTTSNVRH